MHVPVRPRLKSLLPLRWPWGTVLLLAVVAYAPGCGDSDPPTAPTTASAPAPTQARPAPTITVSTDPTSIQATKPFKVNVTAKRGDTNITGKLALNFGNDEVMDAGDINGTKSVEYTYKKDGEYNLSATVTETDGTQTRETIRAKVEPAPKASNAGGDDIVASEVRWFADCNISGWPIQERVLDVSISSSQICVDYSGRGSKPTFDIGIPVDATLWVFAQFNGVWYGATWDHVRPGTFCKAENAHSLGSEQIMRAPMDGSWVPRSGDQIGFMVSGGYVRRECRPETVWRTNIKLITWP
jgi:hypothetical protein